ncbi:myo-inositol-1(or 4)-monophosphatase [Desulfonauticus submarinus]|uniref:Inositol-1-monophosphatase n=1 Tax=Desulfonauticus submarinus TaxID=206665 RepID=A0A1H0FAE2_9BACT|nr:inositol monophosphatase family protein [Desulfonauticus submarinus]SDN91633.1 myo-inositol-1(or 4)-monophosphatase [Desulfonauticus submarinus]
MNKQLTALTQIIYQAGDIIKKNWDKPRKISHKGEIDLVTDTDVAVENFLIQKIKSIFPNATFLAEEQKQTTKTKLEEETFIIDPLDGTTNFAHGFPFVAISVAYAKNEKIVLGFIYLPILNEFFFAQKEKGAFLNGKPISVSKENILKNSLIATGFPYNISTKADYILKLMKKVLLSSQGLRRAGAAAIDLAYTACGRFEGFYEIGLKPWDTAAGWLLVEEAGGKVTNFSNEPYNIYSNQILATNGLVHQELVDLLTT